MGPADALGDRTWTQLRDQSPTLLIPVGSCEQHGPHLPLDTDTRIATAVAVEVADRLGHLLAPAIPYGSSGEHQGFPGTISLGTAALTTVLVEFGRSACDWARRLVFVNGHGGNVEALCSAVVLLRSEGRDVAWCTPAVWRLADAHAGLTETSVLLHLSPQLVRMAECAPGNTEPLAELMPRMRAGGVGSVSESGVLGDPTAASASDGALLLAEMVEDCADRIRRWRPQDEGMLV